MTKAERLIETLLENPEFADDGILANDLLREFHRGFSIAALRPLLSSRNEKVLRVAAFVASELGNNASPLLSLIVKLLHYPNRFIRADAICSVLTCAGGNNQREIAMVISLLHDPDWPIRWKTMEFLSLASSEQLKAGLWHFEGYKSDSEHIHGLSWLTSENGRNPDEIASWLASNDAIHRKYGAVAAARIAPITNSLLLLATSNGDKDVKQFAESMLTMRREAKGDSPMRG
jgi:hypothetical protein